jgi:hypothetical protein
LRTITIMARKESRYRSGRSPDWIKSKNPNAPSVKRETQEEWGGEVSSWRASTEMCGNSDTPLFSFSIVIVSSI